MELQSVSDPSTFWDVNMADPINLSVLHDLTGHADDPQRVLFRNWLRKSDCLTMLDCGAGPGWELEGLRKDNPDIEYTGLEVTNLFLQRLAAQGVSTIKATVEDIPCDDNSYDLVYCRQVLEHVGNFRQAIHEMIRVAKFYVFIVMNKDFGEKTIITKQYGLWHNVYSMDHLMHSIELDKVEDFQSLGMKSYIINLRPEVI